MSAGRRLVRSLALTPVLALSAAHAQGRIIPIQCAPPRPIDQRVPMSECRPIPASVVRTRSEVRVELVDQVLRYEVEERFTNRGASVGEADYLFPLPAGAAFQDLKLSINGELVAGETLNATDARRIYEEIVRRQRDPALVEWMGSGLLRARIFPINPGEEKRVVVRFQAAVRREGDALRIDWFGKAEVNAATPPSTDRAITPATFSLTYPNSARYGRAYSPTHELDVSDRGTTHQVMVRGNARDVTVLVPVRQPAEPSIATLAYAPGGEDGFALITVSPPAGSDRSTTVTPRDITLVLDVSGSMAGVKMEQARAAARQVLQTLSSRDRFRLVDFATDVHTFRDDYTTVTPANLRAAREYIDQLDASGSTNIEAALKEAVRPNASPERLSLVLFITDGEPTVGEQRPDALVDLTRPYRGDPGRSPRRIFTFGVGADLNASLLEQLALEGSGTSQFVRPDESVERAVGLVASRLVDPVLTDISVRAEGSTRLLKVLPPRGTDLFAGQDLVVLARYSGSGSSQIIVEGRRGNTPVRWTQTVDLPARDRANLFVARLWATQRVGYLSAERRRSGGSTEVDGEIRELGERYGIVTPFNSYLVKEPGLVTAPLGKQSAGRGGGGGGGWGLVGVSAAGVANAPVKADAFAAARAASEQRAARSLGEASVMDSLSRAANPRLRSVEGRTFQQRDSVWVDASYKPELRTVSIKPYSKAWFDLVTRLPELKAAFALGDRVIVAGRRVAVSVAMSGVEALTTQELDQLVAAW